MHDLKPGDAVDVKVFWAGCAPGYGEPLSAWFGGYEFVREGRILGLVRLEPAIVVRHTSGTFAGLEVNYRPGNVRKSLTGTNEL